MPVWCKCCELSGRSLCDELITCPEESYRLRCVVVYDLETSWVKRLWSTGGCRGPPPKKKSDYVSNRVKRRVSDILEPKISEVMQTEEIYESVILAHHQRSW
jgi:hypothetical protein